MRILELPLIFKWYDMIESGEKTEEYREIKEFWIKRLATCKGANNHERTGYFCKKANCYRCLVECNGFQAEDYTHIRFRRGYTKETIIFKIESIVIGKGNPKWGATEGRNYFIIKFLNDK